LRSLQLKGQYNTSDRLKFGHSVGFVEYLLEALSPMRSKKEVLIKQYIVE
jgi:hypothetical protein